MNYQEWESGILGAESVRQDSCVVCGKKATNQHHVIPKRMGGVGKKGKESPTLSLCGMGNASGCHKLAHSHELHFRFTDRWEFLLAPPMKTLDTLDLEGWRGIRRNDE